MKVKYRGDGKVLIQGIARELKDGDILDLPKNEAYRLVKANRFFELVEENKVKKPKLIKIEED